MHKRFGVGLAVLPSATAACSSDGAVLPLPTQLQVTTPPLATVSVVESDDPMKPPGFHGNGVLHWSGAARAYASTDLDTLIQIDLS